jgi:hypothetical protein
MFSEPTTMTDWDGEATPVLYRWSSGGEADQ